MRCPNDTDGDGNCSACIRPEWECAPDGTGPHPALGRSFRLQPWQVEILQTAMGLGPDERLVIMMPRQHAHPIWAVSK